MGPAASPTLRTPWSAGATAWNTKGMIKRHEVQRDRIAATVLKAVSRVIKRLSFQRANRPNVDEGPRAFSGFWEAAEEGLAEVKSMTQLACMVTLHPHSLLWA